MRLRISLWLFLLVCCVPAANAAVPEWLRAAARDTLPSYKEDVNGVVLLHEEVTTVDPSGEMHTVYREAVKILRPNDREGLSTVAVHYDDETKLTYMKGWSITASGQEYEVKEKDAIETNAFNSADYLTGSRMKVLTIPGGAVGSVIGYEYQQRRRPLIYEDIWSFQRYLPVRMSRYMLRLPSGWEIETFWNNHAKIEPVTAGSDTTWQIADVPAIEEEDYMPPRRAIAGRMLVHFFAPNGQASAASWSRIGSWYSQLTSDRRGASPEIKAKVQELTATSKTTLEKVTALARWVQKEIRYVAIEIGIGGHQPRPAADVFRNRYGDCKDKVTLLSAMMKEVGVDSNYILIHTDRGVVRPESPSAVTFDHVILAMRVPKDMPTERLRATYKHPEMGLLLLFDPTDEMTPFGDLPGTLQETKALLVSEGKGELIDTPLLVPGSNQLQRDGKLKLGPDGSLTGEVEEARTGTIGRDIREMMLKSETKDRSKTIEHLLSQNLASYQLTKAEVGNLDDVSEPLYLRYNFRAPEYAKKSGTLMLLRPRVVGLKQWSIMEGKKRLYPVEFEAASNHRDTFEIEIPAEYEVDELPDPVDVTYDFAEYHSKIVQTGNTLKYSRQYVIKKVIIPTERLEDLKKFYRSVANDERNTAVLKRKLFETGK